MVTQNSQTSPGLSITPEPLFQDAVVSQQCLNIATNSMIATLYGLEVCGLANLPNSPKPPMSVKSEDIDGINKHMLMPYFGICVLIIVFAVKQIPCK